MRSPSYQSGFYSPLRGGVAQHPSLWRDCAVALNPGLGASGSKLMDHSAYGNHGTLTNMDAGTDWVCDSGGIALQFESPSTAQYVDTAATIGNLSLRSFSGWVRKPTTGSSTNSCLIGHFNGNGSNGQRCGIYWFGSNDTIYCVAESSSSSHGSVAVSGAVRVHLYMLYDGSGSANADKVKLFVNGVERTLSFSGTIPTAVSSSCGTFGIGKSGSETLTRTTAFVSDVRVFNRALTLPEIKLLAQRPGIAYEQVSFRAPRVPGTTFTASSGFAVAATSLTAIAAFTQPTYSAGASLTTKANTDAAAQFTQPVYAASASLSAKSNIDSVATFTQPTYAATGLLSTKSNVDAIAAFTQPTYAATASLSSKSNIDAVATFSEPIYTSTVTLQTLSSLVASATFTAPTYAADAAVTVGPTALTADAIHSAAVYSVTASLTTIASSLASATFTQPVYAASASIQTPSSLVGLATFSEPIYAANAVVTSGPTTLAASATFAAPVYSASVSLTSPATLTAIATFVQPSFTSSVAMEAGPVSLTAVAQFTELVIGQYLGDVISYTQTVVCYRSTVRAY